MIFAGVYSLKTGIAFLGKVYYLGKSWDIGRHWLYTLVILCIRIAVNGAKKNIPWDYHGMLNITGGWGGIRTPGSLATSAVFKTVAFDRSATHPELFFCFIGMSAKTMLEFYMFIYKMSIFIFMIHRIHKNPDTHRKH